MQGIGADGVEQALGHPAAAQFGRHQRLVDQVGQVVDLGDDPHAATDLAKILVPGQELVARRGKADEISQTQTAGAPEEEPQVIQFDDVSLNEAVERMNRYAEKKLVVVDPKVGALRAQALSLHDRWNSAPRVGRGLVGAVARIVGGRIRRRIGLLGGVESGMRRRLLARRMRGRRRLLGIVVGCGHGDLP